MATSNSDRGESAQLAEKIAQLVIWPLRLSINIDVLVIQFPPQVPGFTATVRIINHWRLHQMKTNIVSELSKLFLNVALTGEQPNWTEVSNRLCANPPPPLESKKLTYEDVTFAASIILPLVKLKENIAGEKDLWNDRSVPSRKLLCDCYKLLSVNPIGRVILSVLLLADGDSCVEVINTAIQYCTAAAIRRSFEEWHSALVAIAPIPVSLVA